MSLILFLEDWDKPENATAIVDIETPNKSFLNLALKYKSMGIKNYAFILQLHDPRLVGVDPHDPNLTIQQMTMIGVECRKNFFYLVRSVFKAPATAGLEANRIEANRGNVSLWWAFFNHVTYALTQPRQTGKSFSTDLLMAGLMNFICANTKFNLLTKDDILRAANVRRMKEILDELPPYLNFKDRSDSNNTEMVTINRFNNRYDAHVPQSSPKNAYKIGRGLTTPILQIDEAPFQPNIEIAMSSALGAMGANIERAQELGEPYGVILTTTAGKKDDPSGKYIYNFIQEAANWSERFLDAKNVEDLKKMVIANSRAGKFRIYGAFSHLQLGKTDEWLKEQLDRVNASAEDANRDFFNIWTSGTQSSPIPVNLLEKMNKSIREEKYQQIWSVGGYILRWYLSEHEIVPYMLNNKVIVGIDTSDAAGGDDISTVFIDVQTGEVIAAGTFNETNLIMFAQWLVVLLETYDNTTMVIERRSSAITIIDYLLMFLPQRGMDPFKRLFNWVVNDPLENRTLYEETRLPMRKRSEDLYVRAKKFFGFATSGSGQTSRSELYSTTLLNAMRRCADKIKDRLLIEQISGLIIKNGRVDHDTGSHDDLAIGYLLSHWLLTMGKNLIDYGIDSKTILIEHKEVVHVTPAQMFFKREQQEIREKIERIYEQLSRETDEYVFQRLEKDLRYLDSKLILEQGESFSVDAIINEANRNKKNKTRR